MDRERPGTACERLIHYEPLESQLDFHMSPARFKGFSGPVGSGKSAALCHEAIKLAYLNPGRTGLPPGWDANAKTLLRAIRFIGTPRHWRQDSDLRA